MFYIQQTTFHSCSLRDGRSIHARENGAKKNSRAPSSLEKKNSCIAERLSKTYSQEKKKHSWKRFRRKLFTKGQFEQKKMQLENSHTPKLPKLFSDGPVPECSAVPLSRPSSGNVSGAQDNNGCCQVIFIFVPLKEILYYQQYRSGNAIVSQGLLLFLLVRVIEGKIVRNCLWGDLVDST